MTGARNYTFGGDINAGNVAIGDGSWAGDGRGFPARGGSPQRGDPAPTSKSFTDEETAALAAAYDSPVKAASVLRRSGIQPEIMPAFDGGSSALEYWEQITRQVDLGRVPDGRSRILAVASVDYPASPVLGHGVP